MEFVAAFIIRTVRANKRLNYCPLGLVVERNSRHPEILELPATVQSIDKPAIRSAGRLNEFGFFGLDRRPITFRFNAGGGHWFCSFLRLTFFLC
jgi:hypothetical protein